MEDYKKTVPEYWAEFMALGSADAYIRYRLALEEADVDDISYDQAP